MARPAMLPARVRSEASGYDGRFKLQMEMERSSVSPDTPSTSSLAPVVRQFKAEMNPVLKDGQTIESIVATDPLNGHVFHVNQSGQITRFIAIRKYRGLWREPARDWDQRIGNRPLSAVAEWRAGWKGEVHRPFPPSPGVARQPVQEKSRDGAWL